MALGFSGTRRRRAKPAGVGVRHRIPMVVVCLVPWAACRSSCEDASHPATPRASESVASTTAASSPSTPTATAERLASPVTLAQLDQNPYNTSLDLEPDAIYLMTMTGAYRLVPGQAPHEMKLDLNDNAAATPTAFIFWSKGLLWLAPKRGGPPGPLAGVKNRPIYIVAVGERFAWVGRDEQGRQAVYVLRDGKPHALYAVTGKVAAATMVEDRVVFLERVSSDSWRLGSVATDGGSPSFTTTRKGRYPAMLAAAKDVYYYYFDDQGTSEVWSFSPDLRTARVVASNVTCSPLAVADRVFCANMEGLYQLSPATGLPKLLYPNAALSIAALAVDSTRVVWVSDVGRDQLEVKLLYRNEVPPG